MPPKAKLFDMTYSHSSSRPSLDDVIQLGAGGIDACQIDRRGEPTAAHHFDRHPRFQRAAGAERVAHVTLERTHRHVVAEQFAASPAIRRHRHVACPCREH